MANYYDFRVLSAAAICVILSWPFVANDVEGSRSDGWGCGRGRLRREGNQWPVAQSEERCGAMPVSAGPSEVPRAVYRDAVGKWIRNLHIEKQVYVLKCYRLPDELGQVRKSNTGLDLIPLGGSKSKIPEVVFIAWGARAYLVEPDRLIAFCNAVNYGKEPRKSPGGLFLLRDGDWDKEANGLPDVPADVKEYLLAKPIVAKIAKVMPQEKGVRIRGYPVLEDGAPVIIDRGRKDGVREGMRFTSVGESDRLSGFVTLVEETRSTLLVPRLPGMADTIGLGLILSTSGKPQAAKDPSDRHREKR